MTLIGSQLALLCDELLNNWYTDTLMPSHIPPMSRCAQIGIHFKTKVHRKTIAFVNPFRRVSIYLSCPTHKVNSQTLVFMTFIQHLVNIVIIMHYQRHHPHHRQLL